MSWHLKEMKRIRVSLIKRRETYLILAVPKIWIKPETWDHRSRQTGPPVCTTSVPTGVQLLHSSRADCVFQTEWQRYLPSACSSAVWPTPSQTRRSPVPFPWTCPGPSEFWSIGFGRSEVLRLSRLEKSPVLPFESPRLLRTTQVSPVNS